MQTQTDHPSALRTLYRSLRHRVRNATGLDPRMRVRWNLAKAYLVGDGLEIGALHMPLKLPSQARVRYVDRMAVADLRAHYPELNSVKLVEVDIIDNGEQLNTIQTQSQDFVIANHLLEHCQDPIQSIKNWLRVLKPGGVLYAAVPDKRETFDRERPVTSLAHLIHDHEHGPEGSRRQHFEEWVRLVQHTPEAEVESHVAQLMEMDYSIHFHVWTELEVLELLLHCAGPRQFGFSIEAFRRCGIEMICVLRKQR